MLRPDTNFLSRLWNALSRKSPNLNRSKKDECIRLPPGLTIPPSRERATLYRKWHDLEHQATTANSRLRCYECRLPPSDCRCRSFVYDLTRYSRNR